MDTIIYSHNYGEHAISESEINSVLEIIRSQKSINSNNVTDIKGNILSKLRLNGWSDETKISKHSNITITSMKRQLGMCFQTGNVSRFYADILKLESLYRRNKITAGFYIIPTKESASSIGSNVANYDRFIDELKIFKHIITMPLLVVGIE